MWIGRQESCNGFDLKNMVQKLTRGAMRETVFFFHPVVGSETRFLFLMKQSLVDSLLYVNLLLSVLNSHSGS